MMWRVYSQAFQLVTSSTISKKNCAGASKGCFRWRGGGGGGVRKKINVKSLTRRRLKH